MTSSPPSGASPPLSSTSSTSSLSLPEQQQQQPVSEQPSPSTSSTPALLSPSSTSLSSSKSQTPTPSRPRSGSLPMAYHPTRAPAPSSSLRVEVLADDQPTTIPSSTPTSATSSHSLLPSASPPSTPTSPSFYNTQRSGPSSVSNPSKLRHVTSLSAFDSTTATSRRSRSGSITSPRPPNLSLLNPPSPGLTPSNTTGNNSSTGASAGTAVTPSHSPTISTPRRPRSGSAAAAVAALFPNDRTQDQTAHLNEDGDDTDLVHTQLNLSLDQGPPQSIDTWEPVIPDILVQDEDADENMKQPITNTDNTLDLTQHDDPDNPDGEEEKIVSQYQVLNLIIPDISEAAAAAEAAEQLELEKQQQSDSDGHTDSADTAVMVSESDSNVNNNDNITNGSSNNSSSVEIGNTSNNEKTMSEYLKSGLGGATDYLAVASLGLGAGLIPPTVSGSSTPRPGTPVLPLFNNSSSVAPFVSGAGVGTGTEASAAVTQSNSASLAPGVQTTPLAAATLASRFRLPFSSRAFNPPSRPTSVHQSNQVPGNETTPYAGSSTVLGINNPMQPQNNQSNLNNGPGVRTSFFDYRFTNFFGGSSIAGSIRSFDPTRNKNTFGDRLDLYEVEFNQPKNPAEEEKRRLDHTTLGRIRKVLRAGFPGRDLDPRTRKPRYKYPTNNIKTTKYTLLTFLPVNLLFQFKRFYNIYFLCAAIFVCAEPSLSPVTEILPLAMVLTITAIKDALEDYRRYQQDKRSNSLECTLVKEGQLIPIKSKDICPGDVLKICKNDKIPADVVLLSTSMDEGACFVETSELDGETNLKRKAALALTSGLTTKEQISYLTGTITTEMPNERLSRLDGRIQLRYDSAALQLETLQSQEGVGGGGRGMNDEKHSFERGRTSLSSVHRSNSHRGGTGAGVGSGAGAGRFKLDEIAPVTMSNVVLRGSWLKNTEWVYGVVLYAGVDTKMMRNLKNTGLKFSTMETKLNRMIVAIFVFNAFLLVSSMCFAYVGERARFLNPPAAWYTTQEGSEFVEQPTSARLFVGQLMNFYVIYTFVIPISVFISVELCRVVQALWMIWDEEMRSYTEGPLSQAELEEIALEQGALGTGAATATAKTASQKPKAMTKVTSDDKGQRAPSTSLWKKGTHKLGEMLPARLKKKKNKKKKNWTRMHVRNSNLNEDLGAVEYIFSDKTGTLTRNVMKLSKWHIGGRTFHELQQPGSLGQRMRDPSITDEEYDLLMAFCRNIVVCHSVIPCEDSKTGELLYEAQSPDESALLEALRDNGVVLKAKTKDSVTVEIFGIVTETYRVLKVLEFTSDRKCMSVIIDTPQGIQLFCKGADNVILARADNQENDPLLMRQLDSTVRRFSIAGLRTLMLAWRPLSPEEYRNFDEKYSKAECHIGGTGEGEDATEDREELIRVACETIESRLRLLGCTAIEDRLQDQVPETIEYLMEADIKIWLLTGDKQETAINIGISSRLISPAMKILVLNVKTERDCRLVLEYFVEKIKERDRDEERFWQEYQESLSSSALAAKPSTPPSPPPEKDRYALVVNGESLAFVLGNEIFEDMFLRIGTNCHSVICCRVTPLQKALVVKLVRKELHKVTLAIGDGANDISMIQAAHVGVGIEGMEGAQAARSSDFSFKQFKNLRRLLTIHGRYSYLRMSKIIFFSFYKSICLITVQFWFGFMNGWSGGPLYDEHFLTLWNMVFTALLPIATACFEKDVEEESIGQYPKLFKAVKDGLYWNTLTMAGWGLASLWHSGVLFGGIYGSIMHGIVSGDSVALDVSMVSFIAGSLVLITVTLKMLLMISHYTMPIILALGISMGGYLLVWIGLEIVGLMETGVFGMLHSLPFYYLALLVIPVACLLPDYALEYCRRQFWPSDAEIIQEEQRLTKMKKAQLVADAASAGTTGFSIFGRKKKNSDKDGKKAAQDLEDQEAIMETDLDREREKIRRLRHQRQGEEETETETENDEDDEEEDREGRMQGVDVQVYNADEKSSFGTGVGHKF
ncbi:hypothetical protein BX616_010633 [Lobosporangium transversale]|nr:hypothetical protein BX616_010633 [Lobosporangium transversale]